MASPSAKDSSPINSVFLDRFPKMACSGDFHPHPVQVFPGVPSVLYIACFISDALCPLSFVCFYFLLSNCSVWLLALPWRLCSLPQSVSSPALQCVASSGLSRTCEDTQTKLSGHLVPRQLGTFSLLLSLSPPTVCMQIPRVVGDICLAPTPYFLS